MTDKELLKEIESLAEYRKSMQLHKASPTFDRDMEALQIVSEILKTREVTEEAQEGKITVKELSNIFEMNTTQIASAVGYSRSGFVYSFNSKAKVSPARIEVIANALRKVSDDKYVIDEKVAMKKKLRREQAIRRFIKSYGTVEGGAE